MKIQKITFIVLTLVLLAVPALRVYQYENTLAHGKVFKFETQPVDPYDLFRGRYVALRFKAERTDTAHPDFTDGAKIYMTLTVNAEGFAEVESISTEPLKGENVIIGRYDWRPRFPFDRYFMEENAAPEAERVWRNAAGRNSGQKTWVQVRVLNGKAVLEGLYIDGVRIEEVLRNRNP